MKFTIKTKLYLSFGAILVFLLFVGIYSIVSLNQVNQKSTEIASKFIPMIDLAHKIDTLQSDFKINEYQYLFADSMEEKQKIEQEMKEKREEFDSTSEQLVKNMSKNGRDKWDVSTEIWYQYLEVNQRIMDLSQQNKIDEAMQLMAGESFKLFNELSEYSLNGIQGAVDGANTASAEGDKIYAKSFRIEVILIIAAIMLSIIITLLLCRNINRSFKELIHISNKVASGDLSESVVIKSKDEFAELGKANNEMIHNLKKLILNIQDTSEQVAASSEELTASAEQSAQVTNDIANSINEVANSALVQLEQVSEANEVLNEMSKFIEKVATRGSASSEQANNATQAAQEGSNAVQLALRQMNHIEETIEKTGLAVATLGERSKEIIQIVEVISDIASQTNLLALNAAIEAARAGEHGKGFAVVADEVRKLAEQSQKATEDIGKLIHTIQIDTEKAVHAMQEGKVEVGKGSQAVNIGKETIHSIVEVMKEMSENSKEIAREIKEVEAGTQHILSSANEVDNTSKNMSGATQTISAATEEQSAAMEQISSSSKSLAELAQSLDEETRKFTL